MKNQTPLIVLAFLAITLINLLSNIQLLKFHNFNFHTDIARDFFLIKDIVDNKQPSLLGARVGEISGLFHGPAWLYLNLPVFILSKGNPIAQNYFFLGLTIISEIILFFITKKIFNFKIAVVALLIYTIKLNDWFGNYFHPFGAILFSPLFYYFFYQINSKKTAKTNFLALGLTGGILAQFQLGFGLPMVIVALTRVFGGFVKKSWPFKKLAIFLLGLAISLSNFIIFDLRHNFLQAKAVIGFLTSFGSTKFNLSTLIQNRPKAIIYSSLGLPFSTYSALFFLLFLIILFILAFKNRKNSRKKAHQDFLLIFVGFWTITLINPGSLQGYHYWGLLPISIIILASLLKTFSHFGYFLILLYILFNINTFSGNITLLTQKTTKPPDYSSWQFISSAAQGVFQNNQKEFGYFAYTPDLYSYTPRYAMEYWNQFYQNRAHSFQKKEITYLLISPPPQDKPWLEATWWKENQVKIKKEPEKITIFENGFKIEEYHLSEKERQIPANPNLINSIHFR